MSTERFILPDQESISISGKAAEKLIRRGDGQASLLYIYMLKSKGNLDMATAQAALGYTEQQIYDAMCVLRAMGLISGGGGGGGNKSPVTSQLENEELPDYTSEEITREIDTNSDFSLLTQEVQNTLNKVLTANDLKILLGMYQHLEMPSDVILLLISYCIDDYQEVHGKNKFPTMRGVEKVAYTWLRNGILTLEEAMKYIKRRTDQKSAAGEAARVLQLKNELTPTQRKYIYLWLDMGFGADAIEVAYDRTIINTGELKWNYMNSIISNWHEKGLHSLEEIEAKDSKKSRGKPVKNSEKKKPDHKEFQRIDRFLEELKNQ